MEKEEIINNIPKKLRIDICNLCQLDCPECWIRKNEDIIKEKYGGFGYVSFETYKNFVDKHPFIEEIELSHNGEIFLNPDLNKIIKYSFEKNIALTAYNGVNLNHLTEETAENLVKYKFRIIYVSIDGATPETYSIYRRKGDFNKVIENIKLINKYKEKYNSEFPHLTYKFILFGHNEHEIEQAKELAKELKMKMYFVLNQVKEYSPLKNIEKVKELTGLSRLDDNIMLFYENYKNNNDFFFCLDLFTRPQINWNGDLDGCCITRFWGDNYSFGVNIFKEGLINALNNEKIIYAKEILSDLGLSPRSDIPCCYCHIYRFLKENNFSLF